MRRSRLSNRLALAGFFLISGCDTGPAVEDVSGIVTLDGQPLSEIRVLFQPLNKDAEAAGIGSFGLTDAEGKFSLKLSDSERNGAVVGVHNVILSDKLTEGPEESDAGDIGQGPRSRIPFKYNNSPPTFEVKRGEDNHAAIELTSISRSR